MLRGNEMLGISLSTRGPKGIRSSELGHELIRGFVVYVKESKTRTIADDRNPRDVKRTPGRKLSRWSDFPTDALNERRTMPRVPQARKIHRTTLASERRLETSLAPT
uniref:Uncharacterized protein n=1 Tax=Haemonchus contortus TaxID=6289 RepID=A0A7I4YWK6_HAECO